MLGRLWRNAYICLCTSNVCIVSGLFTCAERIFLYATRKSTELSLVWSLTIERKNRDGTILNGPRYRRKTIAMTPIWGEV